MDPRALLCNICPRRPTFSDVSHLLTHVSSKAHLSNYFKLQVRSHQEVEAGQLLDNYDLWYKAHNLPKLLSDRMAAKESRKTYHGRSSIQFTTAQPSAESSSLSSSSASSAALASVLDPRLSDPFLGMDSGSGGGRGSKSALQSQSQSVTCCSPGTPHRQVSHMHGTVDYPSPPSQCLSSVWKREDDCQADGFLHAIPTWNGRLRSRTGAGRRRNRRVLAAQSPPPPPPLEYDPFVEEEDDESFHHVPLNEPDKERADEFTKLKGILWPGMDIFDAATEHMKRKRNQKKDESVVKTMEKTSKCVEPTELVFSPTGILRRQRVISGEVEDSSPLRGESPIPKRIPRPKRVLSQVDPNVRLGQGRKRLRKSSARNSPRVPFHKVYNLRSPRVTRAAKPLPLRSSLGPDDDDDADDDDDDFDLTMRGLDPKPRSGFSIFCDEQAVSPGAGMPPASTSSNRANLAKESTPVLEKESLEPFLGEHERVESLFSLGSPVLKRRLASDAAYPPRAFLHDSPRFGFDMFDDQGGMAAVPALSRLDAHGQDIYAVENSSDASMSHLSPMLEEDAFERFCLTF